MTHRILGTRTSVLTMALLAGTAPFAGSVVAQTQAPPRSPAKVTSQEEGAMEGVLVSAKRAGSTMTVTVVSNAQGQYSFPRDRLEPGKYSVTIRAVGYELPAARRKWTWRRGRQQPSMRISSRPRTSRVSFRMASGC